MKTSEKTIQCCRNEMMEVLPCVETELVFILDKSGSMQGFEADTVGGFNAMLQKQKEKLRDRKIYVTTVLFSNQSEMLHDRVPIENVTPLCIEDYQVGGMTALYDAFGSTVEHIGKIHRYARREDVPEHTIFVVATDGIENASHRFSGEKIKQMVKTKTEKKGWEFIFLGANIDAIAAARDMGISSSRAANFNLDGEGIEACFRASEEFISQCSEGRLDSLDETWKAPLKK